MLRNLAAVDELPDKFVSRIRIENLNSFVALKSLGRSLGRRKDGLEWCQPSEDGTFAALVHWMDQTLVCEELLPLSSQLSPPHGFLFQSDLNIVCKSHLFLNKWFLGNQAYLIELLRFPTQQHSRQHHVGLPAFMLCSIFVDIPAEPVPVTRTDFNYLGNLTDLLIQLHNSLTGGEKIFTTAGPGIATASARCLASSA